MAESLSGEERCESVGERAFGFEYVQKTVSEYMYCIIIFLIGNVQNIYNIHINLGILTFLRNMTRSFQILNTDYFYPHNSHDQEGAQEDVCVNSFP